jgi:UDP-N-acetylmuramoyl-L-alanyl-D-glutamate--2,6-diaminopimelate ligase
MTGTAATPARRPLSEIAARLASEGHLRAVSRDGGPTTTAALTDVEIAGVTLDSRTVTDAALFVAVPGRQHDGHDHAAAAVSQGAAAVIGERLLPGLAVPQLIVSAARPALASAAAWYHGDPSRSLTVIGITGTDGKTTTAYLAVAALEAARRRVGMIGTIATRIGGTSTAHEVHATTPEAPELQAMLRAMVDAGDDTAVVETTSHGLAMDRVGSVDYDVAILTNLSQEHLELHGTWEAYRDAKLRLFSGLGGPGCVAIVNADDPSAETFVAAAAGTGARVVTYGLHEGVDVRGADIVEADGGLRFSVVAPGPGSVEVRLAGRFNVHNALAVVALGEALGLDPQAVRRGIGGLRRVPGRMESIRRGQPFEVVVDFAHSPASLEAVLDELRASASPLGGGVIVVFGSAGERDVVKRPVMGRIAGERCRMVVITDEDPRGEDRLAILDEIARGAEAAGRRRGDDLWLIADRRDAIAHAFAAAHPGDVVLLAGKGHEQSIIGPTGAAPWDDVAVAEAVLASMGYQDPG